MNPENLSSQGNAYSALPARTDSVAINHESKHPEVMIGRAPRSEVKHQTIQNETIVHATNSLQWNPAYRPPRSVDHLVIATIIFSPVRFYILISNLT